MWFHNLKEGKTIGFRVPACKIVLGLAALYLFNVVDAHVDAYFLDFNVDEDISLRVRPFVDNYLLSENFIGLKLSLDYK